jgi:hypothetical protein
LIVRPMALQLNSGRLKFGRECGRASWDDVGAPADEPS